MSAYFALAMNLLKSIGSMMGYGEGDGILIKISAGKLFYLDPSHPTETKRLIYNDCQCVIKKTSAQYQYQLLVTRVFADGEEENGGDELAEDFEQAFLIDPCILFNVQRNSDSKISTRLSWADSGDDTGICGYQLIVDSSVSDATVQLFEDTLFSCMYERVANASHTNAQAQQLASFIEKMKAKGLESRVGIWTKGTISSLKQSAYQTPSKVGSGPMSLTSTPGDPMGTGPTTPNSPAVKAGKVLFASPGQLYRFDIVKQQFVLVKPLVEASICQIGTFLFDLMLEEGGTQILSLPLSQRMNPVFHKDTQSFVWVTYDRKTDQPLYSELIRFDEANATLFNECFCKCLYESLNETLFSKNNDGDRSYLCQAYEDVEMDDVEEEDEEVDPDDAYNGGQHDMTAAGDNEGNRNSHLAVGMHNDRTFVVRGNRIGVFKHSDTDLEFRTTINNISTSDGKTFTPSKVMLHQQDSCMLLMNPANDKSIYKMDLEYGKVIDEWKVDEDIAVDEIMPGQKYAQRTSEQTLVGMNQRSLFQIDPRLSGNKIVREKTKMYATKNGFSALATTGKGELAVGSSKGEIRLFDRLGINAKTLLPGLGDAIIGMDTTENGRYVLATCKTYLILIDTKVEGQEKSGFQKSMGSNKPVPKRLQLKPEHVASMASAISFTPARFNTGEGEEKSIITSTGKWIVTWNFRKVKNNQLSSYMIKEYQDQVVADSFKFGQDRNIIVALNDNVEMVSKSTLMTPTKMLKSRSNIVNSPY